MNRGRFATTRWTLIEAAQAETSTETQAALAALCETYWYPLYAYIRRSGHPAHEAEDLTQAFFARLLSRDPFGDVRQEKGRFRSYLLASVKHFLSNEQDRARALKRGGGQTPTSLDVSAAEQRYSTALADELTPARLFDRQWALTLLERVLAQVRSEMEADGKTAQFDALKVYLTEGRGALPYAEAAQHIGCSEAAAKVAAHRLRKRYRTLLRKEIADTVASPDLVEEELRALFAAFSD